MLVIRLQRVGKKHQASFRIVLQDSRWKPQGKVLELFGFYNPHSKEKQVQEERIRFWLERGAQPSVTLHNMFVDMGIIRGEKVKAWRPKKGKVGEVKSESAIEPVVVESTLKTEPAKEEVVDEVKV